MSQGPDEDLKSCRRCGGTIPAVATMCSHCNTGDPDGLRADRPPPPRPATPGAARRRAALADKAPVTTALIWLNGGMFVFTVFVLHRMHPGTSVLRSVLSRGGLFEAAIPAGAYFHDFVFEGGAWWRAIAAYWLHGGLIHVGMNLFVLNSVGRMLESIVGPWRFFVVYALSGVGSTLAISVMAVAFPSEVPVVMVGASGAVFGVLGALAAIRLRVADGRGRALGRTLVRDIVMMLIVGMLIPMVSNTGHVGGLVVGAVMGRCITLPGPAAEHAPSARIWRSVAVVCAVATAVALTTGAASALSAVSRV